MSQEHWLTNEVNYILYKIKITRKPEETRASARRISRSWRNHAPNFLGPTRDHSSKITTADVARNHPHKKIGWHNLSQNRKPQNKASHVPLTRDSISDLLSHRSSPILSRTLSEHNLWRQQQLRDLHSMYIFCIRGWNFFSSCSYVKLV